MTIHNNITKIADNAFANNKKLTKIIIPNSVTKIGANVFEGCNKLKNITAPAGFKDILLEKLGNQVTFIDNNEKKQKYTILNSCHIE